MKHLKLLVCLLILVNFVCCTIKPTFSDNLHDILYIHYIDVGQGDSILIQFNNKNMLIDSGSSQNKNKLLKYLKKLNINKFDYIIATHPHEDHIGNMASILRKYQVKEFWAPKITTPSKCFERMIEALIDKDLKINVITAETTPFNLDKKLKFEILGPNNSNYNDNLNNYSAIFKLTYGNNSFLFTGDAEELNENELLASNYNLKADVLKIGHHGSKTSSSSFFLDSVMPKYAVISVGKNNDFHHPSKAVITSLDKRNIKTLRTDQKGTIIFSSDGSSINFSSIK